VLKPGFEGLGVHGVVVGLGRDDASQTQAKDEGDRFVMTVRNAAAQAVAAPAPAVATRHVGRRRRLIDEHQFQRIEVELTVEPSPSPFKDVRAVLLTRMRRLFLYVMSWRSKKRQIIDGDTFSPRVRSRVTVRRRPPCSRAEPS
jgi:G:T/U-mismatch repair DNA glycosylase